MAEVNIPVKEGMSVRIEDKRLGDRNVASGRIIKASEITVGSYTYYHLILDTGYEITLQTKREIVTEISSTQSE